MWQARICLGIGIFLRFYFDSFELLKWQKKSRRKKVPIWYSDFAFHVGNHVSICRMPTLVRKTEISRPASDKIRKDIIRTFRENLDLKTTKLKTWKISLMLHSIYAPENNNLIKNQTTHLLISTATQTIRLTSSRHCQISFQNE